MSVGRTPAGRSGPVWLLGFAQVLPSTTSFLLHQTVRPMFARDAFGLSDCLRTAVIGGVFFLSIVFNMVVGLLQPAPPPTSIPKPGLRRIIVFVHQLNLSYRLTLMTVAAIGLGGVATGGVALGLTLLCRPQPWLSAVNAAGILLLVILLWTIAYAWIGYRLLLGLGRRWVDLGMIGDCEADELPPSLHDRDLDAV